MRNGFLGYNASFMLDVVVCALGLVVPLLAFSIYLVKVRRNYLWHRNLQVLLGILLFVAVVAFEIDMRFIHGSWRNIVLKSREMSNSPGYSLEFLHRVLLVHLTFAITTPFLWVTTTVLALKRMPNPPGPCPQSGLHKRLGWLSSIDLTLTAITGLTFYYMAFVA